LGGGWEILGKSWPESGRNWSRSVAQRERSPNFERGEDSSQGKGVVSRIWSNNLNWHPKMGAREDGGANLEGENLASTTERRSPVKEDATQKKSERGEALSGLKRPIGRERPRKKRVTERPGNEGHLRSWKFSRSTWDLTFATKNGGGKKRNKKGPVVVVGPTD